MTKLDFDRGRRLWAEYLQRVMPPTSPQDIENVSGKRLAEALWPVGRNFREMSEALAACSYDPRFEAEADAALQDVATGRTTMDWPGLSLGALKVLQCRWQWVTTAAMIEDGLEKTVNIPLPRYAPEPVRLSALALAVLSGGRMAPPVGWQEKFPDAFDGEFPPTHPAWRQ